ncbi:MAG: response regulator [Campylobacterota bacterium]|nr:response regulator [Campylobacterota bacterium]
MKKVVIIDDELSISDILDRFLRKSGKLDIRIFSDPEYAIKEINSVGADLVLVDIMMPIMNGFDVLTKIKTTQPHTKVVLMTAYNTENKIKKSQELEADGYIEKPFNNLKELENKLFSILNI